MGACFLYLAFAAPWVRPLYGGVLNMFGMGCSMAAATLWVCAQYVWHGLPYGCGPPVGVCLVR